MWPNFYENQFDKYLEYQVRNKFIERKSLLKVNSWESNTVGSITIWQTGYHLLAEIKWKINECIMNCSNFNYKNK